MDMPEHARQLLLSIHVVHVPAKTRCWWTNRDMHAQLIPFSGGQGHALSLLVFAQYVQVPAKQQNKKSIFLVLVSLLVDKNTHSHC